MKKLTLDLDALQVETFDTSDAAAERGTVHALEQFGGSNKPSCISCYGPTDPCICDPVHELTELC